MSIPVWDHIVVCILENKSLNEVYGSASAPYMTSLANNNVYFANAFAIEHPSQPNYLDLFGGQNYGITDDNVHWSTGANVYTQMKSAGLAFKAYSESLPSVGYADDNAYPYARKHCPWVTFQLDATNNPSGNFDGNDHRPFTEWQQSSTFYASLPKLTYVIPNLVSDIHDSDVSTGDTWVQQNLDGYVQWAKTHNSLFILTFDEDDSSQNNQIYTVMAGANQVAGTYGQSINHYTVLGLMQDSMGLPRLNNSVGQSQITTPWASTTSTFTATFTGNTSGLTLNVDGSGSTPGTGNTITAYDWDWGDGTAHGTGVTASHAYASAGTRTVTLTITNSVGATTTSSQSITTTAPVTPTASFTYTTSNLTVNTDASASSGGTGQTISNYTWYWGDAAGSATSNSSKTATFTYSTAGTYSIQLKVWNTSSPSQSATQIQSVTVGTVVANQPPNASFTASISGATVSLDASASSDADGTVSSYAWDFGDGTTGSGVTTTHTYTASAPYTISLTVTDNAGATAMTSQSVTATVVNGGGGTGGATGPKTKSDIVRINGVNRRVLGIRVNGVTRGLQ